MDLNKEVSFEFYFYLADGRVLKSVFDLVDALREMDDWVFEHHVNSEKNDFSNWINDVYKQKFLSKKIAAFKRDELIDFLEAKLKKKPGMQEMFKEIFTKESALKKRGEQKNWIWRKRHQAEQQEKKELKADESYWNDYESGEIELGNIGNDFDDDLNKDIEGGETFEKICLPKKKSAFSFFKRKKNKLDDSCEAKDNKGLKKINSPTDKKSVLDYFKF